MIEPGPPSEQELHAYIDGRLEPAAAARIAAYLARHPQAAALVEAYRAQIEGLHALYDDVLDEPVPAAMLALLRRQQAATLGRRAALAAAVLVMVMVSAGTGWWFGEWRHDQRSAGATTLVEDAQRAHRLYAGAEHWASDLGAVRPASLADTLSERLGAPVALPEVERAGLVLNGVRLVPTASGTAAVLLYRDGAGRGASLFVTPVAGADAAPRADVAGGDVTTLYRVSNGLGYALTLSRAANDPAIQVAFGLRSGP